MFESIMNFFKKLGKTERDKESNSKKTAKERLHLVLMQDRANVSADFLEMMKQEIIEVIKKYIEVDEKEIDVRLTNDVKEDGTTGAPSLYANIPIMNIRNEMKKEVEEKAQEEKKDKEINQEKIEEKAEIIEENTKQDDVVEQEENKNAEENAETNQTEEQKEENIENNENKSGE